MISIIKKRTKNYPLVSALLLVAILAFAFTLMVGLALVCNSGAEASGPPMLGDIEVGSKASEDGAYETTESEPPAPHISVYPQFYYIDGENWPAGIAIDLEIFDGVGGALLFKSDTVSDGEGYFFFHFWNDPDRVELSPGQYVTIEDADGIIKTHLVKNLIITDVDMANDKVYGAAESSANTVLVEIRGDYDVNPVETATFTGVGTEWEADFSAVGIDYSTVAHLRAAELDDDGNRTYQYWGAPHFFVDHHADDLWGYGWSENDSISVQITYASTGLEVSFAIGTDEHGEFWVNLRDDFGYDVAAGDVLELTQGLATLTHTIMDLNIENIDPVNDTVSGTADPNYDVTVEIHGHDPDYYVKASRTVTPETSGEWVAVFDSGYIKSGSYGSAEQFYDLSAATRVHWEIPAPPPRVTLRSPANNATIAGRAVTFRWRAADGATKYQVQIRRANGTVFKNRILGDVLQLRQGGFPNNGSRFKWRVRAGNAAGWGPFSAYRTLTNRAVVVGGFDTNLNSTNGWQGWVRQPNTTGVWRLSNLAMYTNGQANKWVSARYRNNIYTNFDYSVRMRRVNSLHYAQHLFIRAGTNYPADGYWNPGYSFGYINSGSYGIWKRYADGSWLTLQDWTPTTAINKNGWNTLRVRAFGSTFSFYINGTLVRTIFYDPTFKKGRVGVTMYRSSVDTVNTRLDVDWAKLTVLSTSAMLDQEVISPEQEALNKEVMDSGVIGSPEGGDY